MVGFEFFKGLKEAKEEIIENIGELRFELEEEGLPPEEIKKITKKIKSEYQKLGEINKTSLGAWVEEVHKKVEVARIESSEGALTYYDKGMYSVVVKSDIETYAIDVLMYLYGADFNPTLKTQTMSKLENILIHKAKNKIMKFTKPDKTALVFKNGTLYYCNNEFKFSPEFSPENKVFHKFNFSYREDIEKETPSIFKTWAKLKFGENTILFYAFLTDLFLTWNDSQVLPYIHGEKGIGKSVLQELLSDRIGNKSVANVKVGSLGQRFQANDLFRKIINLSSEITDREIDKVAFKGFIARDILDYELKGKESYATRPLAKWLAVAEKLPNIETDGGVQRRILTLEASAEKLLTFNGKSISKLEFKKLLSEDTTGFTEAIKEGLIELEKFNYDLKAMYDELTGGKQLFQLIKQNNSVVEFITDMTKEDETTVLRVVDLFNLYLWATQNTAEHKGKNGKITLKTFTTKIMEHYTNIYNLENRGSHHGKEIKRGNYLIGFNYNQEAKEEIEKYNQLASPSDQINFQLSDMTNQAGYIKTRMK